MYNVKIPEGHIIRFEQESSFENFIGQFQLLCPEALLCVVDGTCLRYYNKRESLPTNIRYDYKQRRGNLTEYYFRDIGNDSLFCVFGREAAKIFYPRIDEVDPIDGRNQSTLCPSDSNNRKNSKSIVGDSTTASAKDPLISIHKNISCQPVESTIQNNNSSHIDPIAKQITKTRLSPQPERKRPVIIQTIRNDNENNIHRKTRTNVQSYPKQVTIIDRGVRFTFPNTNYNVEILTNCPN